MPWWICVPGCGKLVLSPDINGFQKILWKQGSGVLSNIKLISYFIYFRSYVIDININTSVLLSPMFLLQDGWGHSNWRQALAYGFHYHAWLPGTHAHASPTGPCLWPVLLCTLPVPPFCRWWQQRGRRRGGSGKPDLKEAAPTQAQKGPGHQAEHVIWGSGPQSHVHLPWG